MTDYFYGTRVNYSIKGKGEAILLLHGWGGSMESLKGVEQHLIDRYKVINLDFPPFGQSETPSRIWGITDYVNLVLEILKKNNIEKVHIIAHSFGGRVAIYLSANYPAMVEKLVLVDSAGLKPRRGLKYHIKVAKYKRLKRKGKDVSEYGSQDFKSLPENMRATFVKIVNEDLGKYLCFIRADTLIVWGNQDTDTPMCMAKRLKRKIVGSGLVVLSGGHFAYAEQHPLFCAVLDAFLKRIS